MVEPQTPQAKNSPALQNLSGSTVGRGRFAVRTRLGAGGMGEVYRADDTKLKRSVALKRLAPQLRADEHYRRRLLKEAERASALSYDRIAGIYDVLEENGEIFLVMEYVEGQTLRRRLCQPLSIKEFLAMAVQCGEALVAAHQKGIVHRDIKPENIMLTPAGQVKMLDFGVARRLPDPDEGTTRETSQSAPGTLVGTPGYMAPEVLLEEPADGRADIFSLGVVFYEALTGRQPFRAASFLATSDRILHEVPAPLRQFNPRLPAELERIVAKMLAKDPAERYATAADLLVDLRALQRASTDTGRRRPRRWTRRKALTLIGLVLALVVAWQILSIRQRVQRGVSPIPPRKILAVLPFEAIGGGVENRAYSRGLTGTLTAKLTQLAERHSLQVVSTSEVRAQGVTTPEQARKALGVNLVLEGSLHQSGETVRINCALVDAKTNRQLRAATITADASDPFALQDQVVDRVLGMLEIELPPEERRVLAAHGTTQPAAYDYYLRGRGYLQDYHRPENIENAITVFNRALELDSNYAQAYAGLGEAYWKRYESSKETQWVESTRRACARALTLDGQLAAAHICLGTLYNGTGEYEKAVAAFQSASESEPTSDDAYRGLALAYEGLGQLAEAERTHRRAIELRPQYWAGYNGLGGFYFRQARYSQAAGMFEQVVGLTPDNALGYSNLGGVYHYLGRWDKAVAMYEKSLALRPNFRAYSNLATLYYFQGRYKEAARTYEKALEIDDRDYRLWGNLADAYHRVPGEQQKAERTYREAIARAEPQLGVNPRDPVLLGELAKHYAALGDARKAKAFIRRALGGQAPGAETFFAAALVYERLGERDLALEHLRQALDQGYPVEAVRRDPVLADLREDARFQELLRGQ